MYKAWFREKPVNMNIYIYIYIYGGGGGGGCAFCFLTETKVATKKESIAKMFSTLLPRGKIVARPLILQILSTV